MVFVFLLSLHLFLMACYVILIETNKSRLSYAHILFALFIPFVGELALLAADFGRSPASNEYVKPFKTFEDSLINKNEVCDYLDYDETLSRAQLLDAIQKHPKNLINILKSALDSTDIEVVHIAASTIMKIQRECENNIKFASEQYMQLPNNMNKLKAYIVAVGDYYAQGLLDGEAAIALLKQQEVLLGKYLTVLPEDKDVGVMSVNNSVMQGELQTALQKAEFIKYLYLSDIELWKLSLQICLMMNDEKKVKEIINESDKMSIHWNLEQKTQWNEIRKGLKL
jgi:hypothetical protein